MEVSLVSQWAAICVLKGDALHLFLNKNDDFNKLCEETLTLIHRGKCVSDSLFVVLIQGVKVMVAFDGEIKSDTMEFLVDLVLSEDFAEPERALVILLAKNQLPSSLIFLRGQTKLVEIASSILLAKVQDETLSVWLLQTLELIISCMTSRSEVLLLVYTTFGLLAYADPEYLTNQELSIDEICSLINRKKVSNGGRRELTMSVFVSAQVRSASSACRGYAYRVLGLISMRCFEHLGERIIVNLLIKKRIEEVPDNRLIITLILWNHLYIWPDYLSHLLVPLEIEGGQDTLLQDLWGERTGAKGSRLDTHRKSDKYHAIRSVSILSAARIIVAQRIPMETASFMVSEIVTSFILRPSVESVIKTMVSKSHERQRQQLKTKVKGSGSHDDTEVKKKTKKNNDEKLIGVGASVGAKSSSQNYGDESVGASDNAELKASDLDPDDVEDFNVICSLLFEGLRSHALDLFAHRMLLVEILAVVLGLAIKASVPVLTPLGPGQQQNFYSTTRDPRPGDVNAKAKGKAKAICPELNLSYFEQCFTFWCDLVAGMLLNQKINKVDENSSVEAFQMWHNSIQADEVFNNISDAAVDDILRIFSQAIHSKM